MSFNTFMRAASPYIFAFNDTITGGALTRSKQKQDAALQALKNANAAKKQADLERQQKGIAWNIAQRNAAGAAKERELEADSLNEQSRSNAIKNYQAESAGEAALADSGLAMGSTPYAALEASVYESTRGIEAWFSANSARFDLAGDQEASAMESARYSQRASDFNIDQLTTRANDYMDQRVEILDSNSAFNQLLDGLGGALKTVATVYSIGSTIGAGVKLANTLGGAGAIEGVGFGDLLKYGSELKYGELTGDMGGLSGLFKKPNSVGMPTGFNFYENGLTVPKVSMPKMPLIKALGAL